MKTKTPGVFRAMAVLLVLFMVLSMLPVSAFAAYDFDEIPEEMLDNVFLDALEYIGYDVQGQIDDQNIYKDYGSNATAYGSGIGYTLNGPATGLETVADSSTATGRKPDLATFRSDEMCCASYVCIIRVFQLLAKHRGYQSRRVCPARQPGTGGFLGRSCPGMDLCRKSL